VVRNFGYTPDATEFSLLTVEGEQSRRVQGLAGVANLSVGLTVSHGVHFDSPGRTRVLLASINIHLTPMAREGLPTLVLPLEPLFCCCFGPGEAQILVSVRLDSPKAEGSLQIRNFRAGCVAMATVLRDYPRSGVTA